MRILFIVARFPYPPLQGDRLRAYHHIRELSRQHYITLVTPKIESNREGNLKSICPFCEQIEIVSIPFWRRILRLGRVPFTSLPLQTLYFFDSRFRQRVNSLLLQRTFDIVHVQLVRMAPVLDTSGDIPKVIDFIDALSLNMARRARRERGLVAWIAAFEAQRLQHYEQELTRKYDQLIVSSPLDRDAIGSYDNIHVIPNGVDIKAYPYNENGREPGMIVFTGRMSYFPNAEAAIYFATHVFPLILRELPEARFFIVGIDPPRRVRRLSRLPGVEVTGYVPNLPEYLARASVAVAPLQAGSGIQNKVLEAMASGAPVVATHYALGGIEAIDGEHLLVSNDAEGLANQVVKLLKDPLLRRRLARNARRLVEEKYTWDSTVKKLEQVYQLAIERRNKNR